MVIFGIVISLKYRISGKGVSSAISTNLQHGTESCLYFALLQNYWRHSEGEGVTQNSKLILFTEVQHQHLPSHAVDDEKMICFDQNYLTTK